MVSAQCSGSSGPGSSLDRGTALCYWARHFTLTLPLSTQVYKWVPANLLLGLALRRASIPSRGEQVYSQLLHATETGISSGLGHLARTQTLPDTLTYKTLLNPQYAKRWRHALHSGQIDMSGPKFTVFVWEFDGKQFSRKCSVAF